MISMHSSREAWLVRAIMSDLKVRPTKRAGRSSRESGVKPPQSKSGAAREGRYKGVERTGLKTRH
jgi:hypothetical protein